MTATSHAPHAPHTGAETTAGSTPAPAPVAKVRRAAERGHANHGWLRSAHTFSFASYYDPANMGFRSLRVINDDRVAPGRGFGTHPHRDMEIVSYVLEGALEHRDSMGTGSVIRPGDVQRMSAGTGVTHSEYNHSKTEGVHFLQIWILPDRPGHRPSYEQTHFDAASKRGRLRLVASPDGAESSVTLHQDARLYAGLFDGDERAEHVLAPGRGVWVHVARGEVEVAGQRLTAGDAVAFERPGTVTLGHGKDAEVLLFDLG
jgi:redox-sensitive bicupin YhaK (pirin superfamily)